MSFRNKKIEELIKEEVASIITRESFLPKEILATISNVMLHKKGYIADVYVSVIPDEKLKESIAILQKNVYDIQQDINKRLKIRPVPKIVFKGDLGLSEMARLQEVFRKIEEK
jgi:ribosome-binding factor A